MASTPSPGTLPVPPRKSAFFVGRDREARQVMEKPQTYGSVVITGYGGLGKSQLMAAFAERSDADGDVPGGVFWVVADGNTCQVVEALAIFVERLKSVRIPENERQDQERIERSKRTLASLC